MLKRCSLSRTLRSHWGSLRKVLLGILLLGMGGTMTALLLLQHDQDATQLIPLLTELSGSNLLWKVLQAKTPPALAPGVMAQLGFIGLAYAYRHPAIARSPNSLEENRNDE